MLDKQLHRCIYDRKYSQLPELPISEELFDYISSSEQLEIPEVSFCFLPLLSPSIYWVAALHLRSPHPKVMPAISQIWFHPYIICEICFRFYLFMVWFSYFKVWDFVFHGGIYGGHGNIQVIQVEVWFYQNNMQPGLCWLIEISHMQRRQTFCAIVILQERNFNDWIWKFTF